MSTGKNNPVRLNIYVHDSGIRRQIKTMAAQKDVSVSEYCLKAITNQLVKEQEMDGEGKSSLKTAVEKANKFQIKTFRGKTFTVSSADLIREARDNRST